VKVLLVIHAGSNRLNNWGKALVYARKKNAAIIAVVLVERDDQEAEADQILARLAEQASVAEVVLISQVISSDDFNAVEYAALHGADMIFV